MSWKLICAAALSLAMMPAFAEDAPQSVKDLVPSLQQWGKDQVLVQAVEAQNARKMTLKEIQDRDKVWMATEGVDDFMRGLMESPAAKELTKLAGSKPYCVEVFLMDNQGANVAMTNKTSDYWQGDEAKFTNAYNAGKGAVDIGKVKFDDSAQAYLVQVSVPVVDGESVVGALTVGINVDMVEGTK